MPARAGESVDGLFRNKIRVIQSLHGYRVSEDAVILTWFIQPSSHEFILDAGTGCGAIAFGLAVKEPGTRIVGLEIQSELAERAGRGARLNGLASQVTVVCGDVKRADAFFRPHVFDVVVSNPPYHEGGTGRVSSRHERALARHQLLMPLGELFRVSGRLLKPGGRICLIYPASAFDRVLNVAKHAGFEPSRVVWVQPRKGCRPGLVCLEAFRFATGRQRDERTLILYESPGHRTRHAEAILAGDEPEGFRAASGRLPEE